MKTTRIGELREVMRAVFGIDDPIEVGQVRMLTQRLIVVRDGSPVSIEVKNVVLVLRVDQWGWLEVWSPTGASGVVGPKQLEWTSFVLASARKGS